MSEGLKVSATTVIARNRLYDFAVGMLEDGRWIGFARGRMPSGGVGMFLFSEICEGAQLGMRDPVEAVRRTAALAQDPEGGYGGVEEWFIPPMHQAAPSEFRCPLCETVCCDGRCADFAADTEEFFHGEAEP